MRLSTPFRLVPFSRAMNSSLGLLILRLIFVQRYYWGVLKQCRGVGLYLLFPTVFFPIEGIHGFVEFPEFLDYYLHGCGVVPSESVEQHGFQCDGNAVVGLQVAEANSCVFLKDAREDPFVSLVRLKPHPRGLPVV